MKNGSFLSWIFPAVWRMAILLLLLTAVRIVPAQSSVTTIPDDPMGYSPMPPAPADTEEKTPLRKGLEAACWYIPNRLLDITDIPRFHLALGDGMGLSLRGTKYMTASWYEDNALCFGWTKRTPPIFGEHIEEQYFGFLAAHQGDLDRDPGEVGLSAHFVLIGVNAAVSGREILDALAGFAGIDLMADDHGPMMYDYTEMPAQERALQDQVYGPQEGENIPVDPNAPEPGVANTGMPKGGDGGGAGVAGPGSGAGSNAPTGTQPQTLFGNPINRY